MKNGIASCPGIDTGESGVVTIPKDEYLDKLYLTFTTGKIILPLTADITTENVQDNHMYITLISSSLVSSLQLLL